METTKPTIEDLLKPRYKVLLDYPGSNYSVGEIIYLTDGNGECDEFYSIDEDGKHVEWEKFYKGYPKIFQRLEWPEDRLPHEMPDYIRFNKVDSYAEYGQIEHVEFFKVLKSGFVIAQTRNGTWWATDCLPATESEYNEYITSKP